MLPDANCSPAHVEQFPVNAPVTRRVSLDLGSPELGVRLRRSVMLRTSMPEAAVDEDSESGSWKHDVRRARQSRTKPVATTHRPDRPTERQLRSGLGASDAGHLFRLRQDRSRRPLRTTRCHGVTATGAATRSKSRDSSDGKSRTSTAKRRVAAPVAATPSSTSSKASPGKTRKALCEPNALA